MNKIEFFEQDLISGNKKVGSLAILRGGLNTGNPSALMDAAVSKIVDDKPYNEFVEIHLDNPWVRVVVFGINDLEYKHFEI